MSNLQLAGQYCKTNSTLSSKNNTLIIGKRVNPTPKKPLNFLLLKQGKQHKYISSLYPAGGGINHYTFDFGNRSYTYTQNDDTVIIKCTY